MKDIFDVKEYHQDLVDGIECFKCEDNYDAGPWQCKKCSYCRVPLCSKCFIDAANYIIDGGKIRIAYYSCPFCKAVAYAKLKDLETYKHNLR